MAPSDKKSEEEKTYYTVKKIAERWDCSEKNVRRLIDKKLLIAHRFGGLIRVSAQDLLNFERMNRDA